MKYTFATVKTSKGDYYVLLAKPSSESFLGAILRYSRLGRFRFVALKDGSVPAFNTKASAHNAAKVIETRGLKKAGFKFGKYFE